MRTYLTVFFLFLHTFAAPAASASEASALSVLMDTASQGYQAASQKKWDEAIQFFTEAQKIEPLSPVLFLDLGLAHYYKGRPLIAAAWLHAYLEAYPESPKAASVQTLLFELVTKAQSKADALRTKALEVVRHFPQELEADRKQGVNEIALIQALSGDIDTALNLAAEANGASANAAEYQRYLGQNLIAAHNYPEVNILIDSLQDTATRDALLAALGNSQLERNEESYLETTVSRMSPSHAQANLLHIWLLYLTRIMQPEKAEKILKQVTTVKERVNLGQTLIMGYLKKGNTSRAKELAEELLREAKTDPEIEPSYLNTARILTGQGAKVLKEINQTRIEPHDAWRKARELYKLTIVSAWSAQSELAAKSIRQLQEFADLYPSSLTNDYKHMALGYLALDQKAVSDALEEMNALSAGSARNFSIALFWRLLFQDRLEDAHRLIQAANDGKLQSRLLLQLGKTYHELGEEAKAAQIFSQSYQLALTSNAIYVLKDIGVEAANSGFVDLAQEAFQKERVARWVGLAKYWEQDESIADLPDFFEKSGQSDLREIAVPLIQAADSWQQALLFIHGVEAWHEQNR